MSKFTDTDIDLVGNWYYLAWSMKYNLKSAISLYLTMMAWVVGIALIITGAILISHGVTFPLVIMIGVGVLIAGVTSISMLGLGMHLNSTQSKSQEISQVCEKYSDDSAAISFQAAINKKNSKPSSEGSAESSMLGSVGIFASRVVNLGVIAMKNLTSICGSDNKSDDDIESLYLNL